MYTYRRADGVTKLRPFANAKEADEAMIANWNSVVKPSDLGYIIGDVAMSKKFLHYVKLLNGRKRLVGGNHDEEEVKKYRDVGFQKVLGARVLNNVLFTHIPIHPRSLGRFLGNCHGHIHASPSPPGPYFNVSVENVNYTPVTLEDVSARLRVLRDSLTEEFTA
jgi:calcineurin-like phosphoesterase family protein